MKRGFEAVSQIMGEDPPMQRLHFGGRTPNLFDLSQNFTISMFREPNEILDNWEVIRRRILQPLDLEQNLL